MPPKSGSPRYGIKSINVENQKTDGGGNKVFSDGVFRNLRHATRFAIDIGGSLAKVVYISKVSSNFSTTRYKILPDESNSIEKLSELYFRVTKIHCPWRPGNTTERSKSYESLWVRWIMLIFTVWFLSDGSISTYLFSK